MERRGSAFPLRARIPNHRATDAGSAPRPATEPVRLALRTYRTAASVRNTGEASGSRVDDYRPVDPGGILRPRLSLLTFVAVVGLAALGGAWMLLGRGPDDSRRYVSEHSAAVPEAARTVTISTTMPAPSAHARRLSAMLEAGALPDEPTMAEVLTDTECAPDAQMVSRCRNEMRLADGRRIVVRHPHDMGRVPCLAPRERVLLVPAAT